MILRDCISAPCRGITGIGAAAAGVALLVLTAGPGDASAAERRVGAEARSDLSLTVYDSGIALVSETRNVEVGAGETRLVLDDVSAALRPETLLLGGSGLTVVEQSLAADVITPRRLLETHIGRTAEVVSRHPQSGEETYETAELLAVADRAVVRRNGRVEMLPYHRLAIRQVPAHLRLRPTLLATVARAEAGEAALQLRYLSGGLSWQTDYVAELDVGGETLSLTALVTLINQSGSAFDGAALRLVAGEVNQLAPPRPMKARQEEMAMLATVADATPEPQSVGERSSTRCRDRWTSRRARPSR